MVWMVEPALVALALAVGCFLSSSQAQPSCAPLWSYDAVTNRTTLKDSFTFLTDANCTLDETWGDVHLRAGDLSSDYLYLDADGFEISGDFVFGSSNPSCEGNCSLKASLYIGDAAVLPILVHGCVDIRPDSDLTVYFPCTYNDAFGCDVSLVIFNSTSNCYRGGYGSFKTRYENSCSNVCALPCRKREAEESLDELQTPAPPCGGPTFTICPNGIITTGPCPSQPVPSPRSAPSPSQLPSPSIIPSPPPLLAPSPPPSIAYSPSLIISPSYTPSPSPTAQTLPSPELSPLPTSHASPSPSTPISASPDLFSTPPSFLDPSPSVNDTPSPLSSDSPTGSSLFPSPIDIAPEIAPSIPSPMPVAPSPAVGSIPSMESPVFEPSPPASVDPTPSLTKATPNYVPSSSTFSISPGLATSPVSSPLSIASSSHPVNSYSKLLFISMLLLQISRIRDL